MLEMFEMFRKPSTDLQEILRSGYLQPCPASAASAGTFFLLLGASWAANIWRTSELAA